MTPRYDDYNYRYCSVRGLERRATVSRYWHRVTGDDLEQMNADELEHCAHIMRDAAGKTCHKAKDK